MPKEKKRKQFQKLNKNNQVSNRPLKKLTYTFNISQDNLRCFISPSPANKKDRRRGQSMFQTGSSTPRAPTNDLPSQKKVVQNTVSLQKPPMELDIMKQTSNEILSTIQNQGIEVLWNDLPEAKSEIEQCNQWEEDDLIRTFSDKQTISERNNSLSEKNHSFASTLDPHSQLYQQHIYTPQMYYSYNELAPLRAISSTAPITYRDDTSIFEIELQNILEDNRTTLMIKNIPNKYTIQSLSREIDENFQDTYDFLYLPCDIKNNCNMGYGFINFNSTEHLKQFYCTFNGKRWQNFRSEKICVLTYARLQGLSSLIDHFQNTKVMSHKDKKYQPIIKHDIEIHNLIRKQQQLYC